MVYQHCHTDPENVLGHALLENRDEGVYCYCWFNDNTKAQAAKNAVANGDIKQFSIYANQLVQRGSDVIHGSIREVSLVLTGANKGARIENLNFAHSDGTVDEDDGEAFIYTQQQKILCHSEEESEEDSEEKDMAKKSSIDVQAILDGMNEEQLAVVRALYEQGQLDALNAIQNQDDEIAAKDKEIEKLQKLLAKYNPVEAKKATAPTPQVEAAPKKPAAKKTTAAKKAPAKKTAKKAEK